jgi:poly(3-hydroxybutyrate) depolymerase
MFSDVHGASERPERGENISQCCKARIKLEPQYIVSGSADSHQGGSRRMLYQMYQAQADMMAPVRLMAGFAERLLAPGWPGYAEAFGIRRRLAAANELVARTTTTHCRPAFGIDCVRIGNCDVKVTERRALVTPFATLLHFQKEAATGGVGRQPPVLIVAPMSGHFATLLRGTVRTMLPDHDVYLTDWHNARDVPLAEGPFGLDEFTGHVIRFLEELGEAAHVLAVCQPVVSVLSAVAVMAQQRHAAQPRSMTLMAGPVDTRFNPTGVNVLANSRPIEWFRDKLIARVPLRYPGGDRCVYPGFIQLAAFVAMNTGRHARAHYGQYENLVQGNDEASAWHRRFYEEYFAIMDLPAEFYLETIARVFQEHALPQGRLQYRGETIRPSAIRATALLTVEGEMDDICGIGQTMAALDLCSGLPAHMKRHHLQTGVGHYGVFNGRRWAGEIYPQVREMIQTHAL